MAKNTKEDSKQIALDEAIKQIEDTCGKGSIMTMNDSYRENVETIKTGSLALDDALGVGGVPRGRVIEVFGPEMVGKSTLAFEIMAQAQKKGGKVALIDAEHAFDPSYGKKIGLNMDELLISQPSSGEEGLTIAETLIRSGAVDIITVDSVAALVPRKELEGEMGDAQMGLQARLMSQALRKITSIVSKSKTTIIFINQLRMKIGVFFGNPETTPGGMALKFYSSVRLDVRRAAQIKKGEQLIGNRVKVKVVKNKVAVPFKVAEFNIIFGEGIDKYADLLDYSEERGVVTKKGNYYYFGDKVIGAGNAAASKKLAEDKGLYGSILKDVLKNRK